ncbi:rhodanese-like domain-containing protein [Egicoccus sp. AB-alg2]|uniref:rhodanese-like domain-containing protein n=1 Tax=Egicoccus sp. AB-alg2 TaxID=3242693 RepID=UPI00359EF37A
MDIVTLETTSLGDRSYLVHDGQVAAVIDPQRDIDRVLRLLDEHGVTLVAVLETHVHNDYVSGGLELSRRTGAEYHLNADEELHFPFSPLKDGDVVQVGELSLRALHTPGHTPTHLSYVLHDGARDRAVFTGGSLLFGSVGRTDLVTAALTEELTRLQYRSAQRLAATLDDEVEVRPTHGFGSFCSSGETTGAEASTLGQERRDNQALRITDEDDFVATLVAGLDAYPAYYAHMGPTNRRGPAPVDLSPVERVVTSELLRRIHAGEWVVDLRNRRVFAHEHVRGTLNIQLEDNASTYLGWLIPWGTPVTLLADSPEEVEQMQRQLVRIGIDRPAGQVPDGLAGVTPAADRGSYHVTDFAGLRRALDEGAELVVLDARRRLEWEAGHLDMAVHVPLHELEQRLGDVPAGPVWVHCASGYRASIAASLLARSGRDVVLVDDVFDANAHRHFTLTTD